MLLSFHYFSCFVLTVVPLLQHLTLTANRWNQLDSHNILFNVSSIILFHFKKFISQFWQRRDNEIEIKKGTPTNVFCCSYLIEFLSEHSCWIHRMNNTWSHFIRTYQTPMEHIFFKMPLKRLKNESNLTSRFMERTFEWIIKLGCFSHAFLNHSFMNKVLDFFLRMTSTSAQTKIWMKIMIMVMFVVVFFCRDPIFDWVVIRFLYVYTKLWCQKVFLTTEFFFC